MKNFGFGLCIFATLICLYSLVMDIIAHNYFWALIMLLFTAMNLHSLDGYMKARRDSSE